MASYSVIKIKDVDIFECKNTIDNIVPILFDYESNIKIVKEKIDDEEIDKIEFSCKVEEALNRLIIKRNVNIKTIEEKFNSYILENADAIIDAEENVDCEEDYEEYIYNKYKFNDWIEAQKMFLNNYIKNKSINKTYSMNKPAKSTNVFLNVANDKLLDGYGPMYIFDFDLNLYSEEVFYLLLKILNKSDVISCDISDILDSGYMTLDEVKVFFDRSPRGVLLTEGTTDMNFIRDAFSIIYPQYSTSFYFTDLSKVKSDCEVLKHYLLMLGTTGAPGNYIGIFDNDTAANIHYKEAKKKNTKSNIKIIKLPYEREFENYPYRSVSGKIMNTDINGLAVSIELFYPDGVLKENGEYMPIFWSQYDKKQNKYQGNVEDKNILHKKWNKYKKTVISGYDKKDFRRTIDLLYSIINAFIQ